MKEWMRQAGIMPHKCSKTPTNSYDIESKTKNNRKTIQKQFVKANENDDGNCMRNNDLKC